MGLESLPLELLFPIMIQLSPTDLRHLSQTSSYFAQLLCEWNFWADKAHHDFQFPRSLFRQTDLHHPGVRYYEIKDHYPDWEWLLGEAARYGNPDAVKVAMSLGAKDLDGALYVAAKSNQLDLIQWLQRHGANVNYYAIVVAAEHGHQNIVNYLINYLIDPRQLSIALYRATLNGRSKIVTDLLRYGATELEDSLQIAANSGYRDIVTTLVNHGARTINAALMRAAQQGHLDIVRYLVSCGAGQTIEPHPMAMDHLEAAKALAIGAGHEEIVRYLQSSIRHRRLG
jgi:ankyrin repeat protein